MKTIKEVIEKSDRSTEALFKCLEYIKENGDIVVVKIDGERPENQYTVFVSFPNYRQRGLIRADENTLNDAILKVLIAYVEEG